MWGGQRQEEEDGERLCVEGKELGLNSLGKESIQMEETFYHEGLSFPKPRSSTMSASFLT